jgi:hypothetical protein
MIRIKDALNQEQSIFRRAGLELLGLLRRSWRELLPA